MSEYLEPSSEVAPYILCEEVFDENSLPSEEEVIDYAKAIGINPRCEPHLLPIAIKGLMEPLPKEWKPCFDASVNHWYYYNKSTKVSQWEHPLDSVYRNLVKHGRSEGYSSAADDDSKGTVKEDLKSFEEVSDILSSNADKLKSPPDENMFLNKGRPPPPQQPLLFKRKQLQNGIDTTSMSSFQVAKLINNTMRENILEMAESVNIESAAIPSNKERSELVKIKPQHLQPLKRSQTLDPVPSFTSNQKDVHPIKGILRESSFSGLQSKKAVLPLDRLPGERASWPNEFEDEKKRTVRFAKTKRRKSVDLTITFSDNSQSSDEDVEALEVEDKEESISDANSPEHQKSDDNLNGRSKNTKWSSNKLNISPDSLALVNQKLNAINVNKLKEKFVNTRAALESSLCDTSDNETDNTNNIIRAPLATFKGANFAEEQKTGRFHVSKPIFHSLNDPANPNAQAEITENSVSPHLTTQNDKVEAVETFKGLADEEVDEIVQRKTSERLTQIEERITKEIQEKISVLKQQQSETLAKASAELLEEHEKAKASLSEEHELKIKILKENLRKELDQKEEEIRSQSTSEIDALINKLEEERKLAESAAKDQYELSMKNMQDELSERLVREKDRIEADFNSTILEIKEKTRLEIEEIKTNETAELDTLRELSQKEIEKMKAHYETAVQNEEANFKKEVVKCETEHNSKIKTLKLEKESELNEVKTEWDDKITATAVQQRAALELLVIEHNRNVTTLKQQYLKEEEELKRCHAEQIEVWNDRLKRLVDKEPNSLSLNRDYEKMRCEKRLLEDKYRSLKDKYLQLKTDMKTAVEKKLQNRARRRKELLVGTSKDQEGERTVDQRIRSDQNKNDVILDNGVATEDKIRRGNPRINIVGTNHIAPKEGAENDPSSDDQYTSLSLTLPTDEHRSSSVSPIKTEPDLKRKNSYRCEYFKIGQSNVLDEVRSQLKELEEIEEQIPANSQGDTYLRYPFQGPGLSTSAEVDFYRHRVIVEQEAVRAARECLLQQKRELEARQNILRTNNSSNMQQLHQQERDLTEMEVSLHRTRALLGEKMIRLRLLGQTLNRLVDGWPSSTVQIENLMMDTAISPGGTLDDSSRPPQISVKPVKLHRRYPNNKSEIEARIQGLKDWLEKPPSSNVDWNQLTL